MGFWTKSNRLFRWLIYAFVFSGFQVSYGQEFTEYNATNALGQVQLLTINDVINRTGIRAWHDAGYYGQGIKVGILHRDFGGIKTLSDSLENLAITFNPKYQSEIISQNANNEGTLALSLIYQLAPEAEILICQYTNIIDYSQCIDWFITSESNIIFHGLGIHLTNEGLPQLESEAEKAIRAGIVWINAAGNLGGGVVSEVMETGLTPFHQFRSTAESYLWIEPIDFVSRRLNLTWSSGREAEASTIDLDLEVFDEQGQLIASSQNTQDGNLGEIPFETIVVEPSQAFGIRIRDVKGNSIGAQFVLTIDFSSIPNALTSQTIISPATSTSVLTVGTLQGNQIAVYSSRGPLPSGAIKPDMVTIGEILVDDETVFVGSAAAAAIATSGMVLMAEANPVWDAEKLIIELKNSTQDDRDIPGIDTIYGMGRLFLNPPPQRISTTINTPNLAITSPIATKSIVFRRNNTLYLQNADGEISELIVEDGNYDPDIHQSLIAFAATRNSAPLDIYVMDIYTNQQKQLTTSPQQDRHPSISPNGQEIAFTSNRDGNWEIYLINVDGSNERRLTFNEAQDYAPSWSPDGQYLVYQSETSGPSQLLIHNVETNFVTTVTSSPISLVGALWSPDGNYIACYTNTDDPQITLVNPQNGDATTLTPGTVTDWLDEQHLLFHRQDDAGKLNIYTFNINSGNIEIAIEDGTWSASN